MSQRVGIQKLDVTTNEAIKISCPRLRRIRPSMRCADILRNISSSRNRMMVDPDYYHVYGHMDDYLDDSQLTPE